MDKKAIYNEIPSKEQVDTAINNAFKSSDISEAIRKTGRREEHFKEQINAREDEIKRALGKEIEDYASARNEYEDVNEKLLSLKRK